MTDAFSRCHPILNFFYFAVVLGFTMFIQHPVFLAVSFIAATAYSMWLNGVGKILKINFLLTIPSLLIVALNFLEGAVRNLMKTYIQRGKVDVYITYEDYTLDNGALKYNRELASEYITCLKQMQQDFDLDYDIKVSTLSRYPEVLVMEEQSVDEEALWESLEPPLREACEKFVQTRILEGRNLEKDLIGKLDSLEEKVLRVEARSPEVVNAYRTKLEAKVSELLEDTQIDDNRIAAEVILFSDKICNDEETVRLHSHIRNMKKMLTTEKEGIGRKLDFMAQEMNREANTILSKSSDLEISNIAIDLKTEIEKVREQIQNVE